MVRKLPIRVRLTAWYSAILAITFALLGAAVYGAIQKSVNDALDEGLRDRMKGLAAFFVRENVPGGIATELQEDTELRPAGGLLRICDPGGAPIFESDELRQFRLDKCPAGRLPPQGRTETLASTGQALRILSATVPAHGRLYNVQLATEMRDFEALLNHVRWTLLWASPLMLLAASAGGYWISGRALAPVDRIVGAARAMGAHNLSERLEVPPVSDELARLASTLNGLFARLQTSFQRMTRFTADASHELRTPTALIRTTAELALRRPRAEAEYREALSRILNESERTSVLIENLLTLARADSGAALEKRTLDLRESVQEACAEARILAQGKNLSFEEHFPREAVPVAGDSQTLRRLFRILLDNAVKYTPAGGRVRVAVERWDGSAAVEVSDSGIGIAPADLPHIFERFYRADKARSREAGGAGLGLSIAQWIAEAHEAKIDVRSTPGEGTVFQVIFGRKG